MNAFDIAWSLLKEDDTMEYGEQAVSRQRVLPRGGSSFMPVLADSAEIIDREFAEGLAQRMDTSPPKTPTRVVRGREGNWGDEYTLEDDERKEYSRLSGMIRNPEEMNERRRVSTANPTLSSLMAETQSNERRKGHYEKLLNTILQNNMNIHSTSRNYASKPFHQKFQRRLAPNIEMHTRYNSVGRPEFVYMKDPIKDSKQQSVRNVQGWGDLQPDYNTLPMVDFQDTIKPRLSNSFKQQYDTRQTRLDDFGQ
jgi:hypothetical protein